MRAILKLPSSEAIEFVKLHDALTTMLTHGKQVRETRKTCSSARHARAAGAVCVRADPAGQKTRLQRPHAEGPAQVPAGFDEALLREVDAEACRRMQAAVAPPASSPHQQDILRLGLGRLVGEVRSCCLRKEAGGREGERERELGDHVLCSLLLAHLHLLAQMLHPLRAAPLKRGAGCRWRVTCSTQQRRQSPSCNWCCTGASELTQAAAGGLLPSLTWLCGLQWP